MEKAKKKRAQISHKHEMAGVEHFSCPLSESVLNLKTKIYF